ncbi:MAG: hypothetical protein PHV59_07740 [Victivallales bacterium]|nr:hypothetical protein [Victivallales bacterium]
MKKCLLIGIVFCLVSGLPLFLKAAATDKNPTLSGNFFIDADSDSDIDPGAEKWSSGYFESRTVDKLPVYSDFHSWLKQVCRLYKWRLITAEERGHYYFAIFDVGTNNSELAFCFRDVAGKERRLNLQVKSIKGSDLRLEQWGPNASLIQEYLVHNPDTGEVIKSRELNGYIIRMRTFPRHLRVIATEHNGSSKVVFDEVITNIIDSVKNIEDISIANKLPDTTTLEKWIKVVASPQWKLLAREANTHGFFAVFKINDRSFAFCRQLKNNSCIYESESTLKLLQPNGKALKLDFDTVNSLNRRYNVVKVIDGESQVTKYSIIDGSIYQTRNKLPARFRVQYIIRCNNQKPEIYFDRPIDFIK